MSEKFPSQLAERFQIRMPDGLRDRVRQAAERNNRSMNAEIIFLLEWALDYFERERATVPVTDDDERRMDEELSAPSLRDIMAEIASLRAELVNVRDVGDRTEVTYSRSKNAGSDEK